MQSFEIKLWDGVIPFYDQELETPNNMQLLLCDGDEARPCVLVIPGGSYHYREKGEMQPIAEWFVSHGIHAAILNYRVEPNRYPAALADAQRAVKLLRHNAREWRIAPEKIVSAGFSAGGHLAASTVTFGEVETEVKDGASKENYLPDAAILAYPVISVCDDFGHINSGKNLLGDDYEAKKEYFSLQNRVHENMPPVFLWHTVEDSCVSVNNSIAFASAMRDVGVEFEMHIYPHGRHGLALADQYEDVRAWKDLALDWINRTLN